MTTLLQIQPTRPPRVRISAASARLRFNGCEPDYIRDVCKGACCRSATIPMDKLIAVQPWEQGPVEAYGGKVSAEGTMVPVHGRCGFQAHGTNLCWLHTTDAKPGGCTLAPWCLNKNGTVIVHNRYKFLKCFKDGQQLPAYVAFKGGLVLLLGEEQYGDLLAHMEAGGGDYMGEPTLRGWGHLVAEYEGRAGKPLQLPQLAYQPPLG
jgi:hypothetical protein